jgi:hypothetical protein
MPKSMGAVFVPAPCGKKQIFKARSLTDFFEAQYGLRPFFLRVMVKLIAIQSVYFLAKRPTKTTI